MYCKFSKAQCRIPIAFILGRPHYFEVSIGSDYIFCDAFALFRVHSFLLNQSNVVFFCTNGITKRPYLWTWPSHSLSWGSAWPWAGDRPRSPLRPACAQSLGSASARPASFPRLWWGQGGQCGHGCNGEPLSRSRWSEPPRRQGDGSLGGWPWSQVEFNYGPLTDFY